MFFLRCLTSKYINKKTPSIHGLTHPLTVCRILGVLYCYLKSLKGNASSTKTTTSQYNKSAEFYCALRLGQWFSQYRWPRLSYAYISSLCSLLARQTYQGQLVHPCRLLPVICLEYISTAQIWESNPILKGYEPCNLTACPICDTRCLG